MIRWNTCMVHAVIALAIDAARPYFILAGGGDPTCIVGSAAYMAPEAALGDDSKPELATRRDVYALGCIAYELLTGRPPFIAPTVMGSMAKHLLEVPPLASSLRIDLRRRGHGLRRRPRRPARPRQGPARHAHGQESHVHGRGDGLASPRAGRSRDVGCCRRVVHEPLDREDAHRARRRHAAPHETWARSTRSCSRTTRAAWNATRPKSTRSCAATWSRAGSTSSLRDEEIVARAGSRPTSTRTRIRRRTWCSGARATGKCEAASPP